MTEEEATSRAEDIQRIISGLAVAVADTFVRPSISIGMAGYPRDGESAGTLLGIADRRMYTAKERAAAQRLTQAPAA
jgi:diguanylate cyclase (GGDEF)-like protein